MLLSNLSPVELRNTSGNLLRVLHPQGLTHQSEKSHGWESQIPQIETKPHQLHHPLGEAPLPTAGFMHYSSPAPPYSGPDGVLHKAWECLQAGQTSNKKQNDFEHTCREQTSQLWQRGAGVLFAGSRRGLGIRGDGDGCRTVAIRYHGDAMVWGFHCLFVTLYHQNAYLVLLKRFLLCHLKHLYTF